MKLFNFSKEDFNLFKVDGVVGYFSEINDNDLERIKIDKDNINSFICKAEKHVLNNDYIKEINFRNKTILINLKNLEVVIKFEDIHDCHKVKKNRNDK
ncbi:hypothetical protein AT251_23305 [Enterovibrio nigricans]|nr:hypothetical protein [Enterovibrio nigricans]PKF48829.1 hypothetical protein AT251_23305 [Enterovibrio nigricans]